MFNQNLVILGVIISFVGSSSYLLDTLKGKIKPNKVTFLLWSLVPFIAFFAEIKQGVKIQALTTFMVGFMPLLIFIASFVNKKAQWKLGPFDLVCGAISLLGLILWYVTKVGDMAIVFSIFADTLAALPTIVKSYNFPETENFHGYLASVIAAVLTLLTINVWNFANYGFPIYILIVNFIIFALVKFKLGKVTSLRQSRIEE